MFNFIILEVIAEFYLLTSVFFTICILGPEMESDFGITEYIGLDGSTESLQPIQCILKELYSDFIVQEILGKDEQI